MYRNYLVILLLLVGLYTTPVYSQAVLEIVQEPICWAAPSGADSSLTRYVLLSSRTPTSATTLAYTNADGTIVVPSGGTFTPGWCGCCGGGSGTTADNDWYFINANSISAPVWRSGRVLIGTPNDLPADTSHQLQLEGDWQFLPDAVGTRFDWQNTTDTTGTAWYGILLSAPAGLGGSSNLSGSRNTFTVGTSNTVIDRTRLGVFAFAGNNPNDTDHALGAFMEAVANGAWTSTSTGTDVNVWVTAPGEIFPRNTVTFQGDGRVELDRYFTFSDGIPQSLLGFDTGPDDITRHPIAGTAAPGNTIVVNGAGTGLEWGSGGGGGGTVYADGITILGDGSLGDPFRADTAIIKTYRPQFDTLPGTGLFANESVANYLFSSVDTMKTKLTLATVAGQRGGWLANGTSGDSIAVSIPFGVVFGDSQAEGHPALHGRLHPNGVNTFSPTYPDSVGQLSYHFEQLTGHPWVNHGIGGQTTETCYRRFDRDVLALSSNPGDGRGARTLNRQPYIVVIIAGINDVFTAGWTPERTKANIIGMVRKAAGAGIKTVVLNLPGDENLLTPAQAKYIENVNMWLEGGALDEYGSIVVDYNTWWQDPAWRDDLHPSVLIVDDVHPTKVGYDSLANYIYRESLPRLHKIIVRSEVAQTGGITGFSRPTSIRVGGTTTYALSGDVFAITPTAPITQDSVFFTILASTNISGTSFSGFSHIQYVIEDRFPTKRVGNRLTFLQIKGETTSPLDLPFQVFNGANVPIFSIGNDGSAWGAGRTNKTGTTVYGREIFGGTTATNPSNGDNTMFGEYGMYTITSASGCTGVGTRVFFSLTSGSGNTGTGNRALDALTTASNVTATGAGAGGSITTGGNNTLDGAGAGGAITTGSDNLAEGESALASCTSCSQNTAVGATSLFNLSGSTSNNTATGYRAGFGITTGSGSVFNGHNAGRFLADGITALQTPSNSVYVGRDTRGTNLASNENVFGFNTIGNGTNTVTIGNTDVTTLFTGAEIFRFSNGIQVQTGTGSPEGVVTALVGTLYLRSDGGAGTTMYIKESGTGNTGWVAK